MARSVPIFDLKPTQLALGMLEVIEKAEAIAKLPKKAKKKFAKHNPISVVIGPDDQYYIIDGHHHTSACWQAGLKRVYVNVIHDFSESRFSFVQFWRNMKVRHWCHLYDKYGDGPRDPMYLAHDIRGLSDDPYRSLAWLARRKAGFERSTKPFSQFEWANFFREQQVFARAFDLDYASALKKALRLAHSKAASHLPGFKGR